jgi:predicted DNA-binding protein
MIRSITTSIRLEFNLSKKLDKISHELHRGKNWLIREALRVYLEQFGNANLVGEARKQQRP